MKSKAKYAAFMGIALALTAVLSLFSWYRCRSWYAY